MPYDIYCIKYENSIIKIIIKLSKIGPMSIIQLGNYYLIVNSALKCV